MDIYYHEVAPIYQDVGYVYGCRKLDDFLRGLTGSNPVPEGNGLRWGGTGHKFNGEIMFYRKHERIPGDNAVIGFNITVYNRNEGFRKKVMDIIKEAVKNTGLKPLQDRDDGNPYTTWAEWPAADAPSDEVIQNELIPEILRLLQEARDDGGI